MPKGTVINSTEVMPFQCDEDYSSKMILDNSNTGSERLQINEGTLRGGGSTAGAAHPAPYDEVYYVVKGSAMLTMDGAEYKIEKGYTIFIPGGTFHALRNLSDTEDFVILTIWPLQPKEGVNEAYDMRLKSWGKSYRTIHEK